MKPLSEQGTNLGTYPAQIDAGKATVVRLYNSGSSDETVDFYEYDPMLCGHQIGSLTIPAGKVIYAQKKAEDFIKATSNSVYYTKVAYSHMMSYESYGSSGGGGGIVTQNLVVNLDAGDSSSYSGSGTTWNDISGQGNHVTLINGPSYFTSNGGYLRFDGNNDYAYFPSGIDLTGNEITFAIWTKSLSSSNVSSLIFLGDSSRSDGGRILNVHTIPFSSSYYYFDKGYWSGGGFGGNYQGYDRLDGNFMQSSDWNGWRHWVFTANASTGSMKMYRDGTLYHTEAGTFSKPLSNANGNIRRIARSNGSQTYYGEISNLQIYKKELSASEVTQNFDATKSRFGL